MTAPARLHPDDRAALVREVAAEVVRQMRARRPRDEGDERPTVTLKQQQNARTQLERLGLVGGRR